MSTRSVAVRSRQTGIHPRLTRIVDRHQHHVFRRPVAEHTRRTWLHIREVLRTEDPRPLVLDSGCGNGQSALRLAREHPAAWILAIDQSAHRLRLETENLRRTDRILWGRAELGDLWRCMVSDGVRLAAHYLLYPNPWPKPGHLKRRWHGHPAFPAMLALGGRLDARSNWPIYLDELAAAIRRVTGVCPAPRPWAPPRPELSPFERKYRASGHRLFRLQVCLRTPETWPSVDRAATRKPSVRPV